MVWVGLGLGWNTDHCERWDGGLDGGVKDDAKRWVCCRGELSKLGPLKRCYNDVVKRMRMMGLC